MRRHDIQKTAMLLKLMGYCEFQQTNAYVWWMLWCSKQSLREEIIERIKGVKNKHRQGPDLSSFRALGAEDLLAPLALEDRDL
ncbi:hypothetical protein TNCV_3788751 [Trichonephila clavipes]|nr:hypothetical protein TNCV_3788751 [Trichonephila clavipes]